MYEHHPYTRHHQCPCLIGPEAVAQAKAIVQASSSIAAFTREMARRQVIGKSITYDEGTQTIYITKRYACESGGGCPDNQGLVGERCHCDHYNHAKGTWPKYYCQCGAEFYRPMFAPIFGEDVLIEPYRTVLSGDEECVIAVRVGRVRDDGVAMAGVEDRT